MRNRGRRDKSGANQGPKQENRIEKKERKKK